MGCPTRARRRSPRTPAATEPKADATTERDDGSGRNKCKSEGHDSTDVSVGWLSEGTNTLARQSAARKQILVG